MTERRAYFFGCVKGEGSGHALYDGVSRTRGWDPPPGCPWSIGLMDGGLLKNSKTPDQPNGRVIWTCSTTGWHAFTWWDRSGDSRGNSCSGFYVSGFEPDERAAAFAFAQALYPEIVKRQLYPLVLA